MRAHDEFHRAPQCPRSSPIAPPGGMGGDSGYEAGQTLMELTAAR
jgi:hypothetical protein